MNSVRILVLEDDSDFRTVLVRLLSKEGYQVDGVSRGAEALELARRTEYDLVVTDIRMEGMDGLEALSEMKANQPYLESLVMTGYSSEEDSVRAVRLGVGDYLRKPFRLDDFVGAVRRLVSDRKRKHELARQKRMSLELTSRLAERLAQAWSRLGRPLAAEAGEQAERLGRALKLGPETVETTRMLALLAALDEYESDLYESELLPPAIQLGLLHLDERWDGKGTPEGLSESQIPIESRVASLALAIARGDHENWQGRFDPILIATHKHATSVAVPASAAGSSASSRALMSYAQAMEEVGDLQSAESVFTEVAMKAGSHRDSVEARLALARLARERGALVDIPEHLRQARHIASQVGPAASARVALEGGILLARCGLPGTEPLLEEAGRLYRSLRSPSGAALANLARVALLNSPLDQGVLETCLRTLLGTEYTGELAQAAPWLLPYLHQSSLGPGEVGRAVLMRIAREAPEEWARFREELPAESQNTLSQLVPPVRSRNPVGITDQTPAPPPPSPPLLRIYSLGPFEVYQGRSRVADRGWRSQKARYLLGFLAASPHSVSEEKIVDEFWPDDYEKGKRNLYWCTSVLRQKLRVEEWPDLDYVVRSGGNLSLNDAYPRWHDMDEMEKYHQEAQAALRQGDSETAADHYRKVARLCRGTYLEGCYMDWTDPIRRRVEARVTQAMLYLLRVAVSQGRPSEAVEVGSRLLELDPCCQEAYLGSMEAYLEMGRPEEVVRLYAQCEHTLHEELQCSPNAELTALREKIT